MKANIKAEIIKDKSFDPNFVAKISYDDGTHRFNDEIVSVERKPPRVTIEYPESINKIIDKIDVKSIELEIMEVVIKALLGP